LTIKLWGSAYMRVMATQPYYKSQSQHGMDHW